VFTLSFYGQIVSQQFDVVLKRYVKLLKMGSELSFWEGEMT